MPMPLDLRDTARTIRRDPLYAVAVVATLALTLGASTAVFSIVNGVLWRPLAYPDGHRLVSIREVLPRIADKYPSLPANLRHFEEWRNQATTFSAMAALDWRTTTLTGGGDPAQVRILRASGTLFDVFQTSVPVGRPLTRADEGPGRPAVAVISHRLWLDRFGADPQVLGRPVNLGGTPHTIVGVLAPDTGLPTYDVLSDAGSVSSAFAAIVPFRLDVSRIGWMGQFNYPVIARLRDGATLDQARAELNVLQKSIGDTISRETQEPADLHTSVVALDESITGRSRVALLLLFGAVGSVVLIACANLANLSLARALRRMRDAAVRGALGASRGRLIRGLIVEQLLLAGIGGALGLLVASAWLTLFVQTAPIDVPRLDEVVIDGRVLGFAALVATLAGLSVALLPAWRLSRVDLQAALRGGGAGGMDRAGLRVRAALVAMQVALSVALLVVTGLFVSSFVRLLRVDPGFSPQAVVSADIAPLARRYPDVKARAALYDRILADVRNVPSIRSAAWTSALPLTGETWVDAVARVDDPRPAPPKPSANYRFVGPEYFQTLSIPITRGRSILERDRTNPDVPAVVSARVAEALWPGEDPVGRRFTRGDPRDRFELVGVVPDAHSTSLEAEPPLMVYVPYWYNNEGKSVLMVRTAPDAVAALAGELRRIIHAVDPEIAIASIGPLQRIVDEALASRRYQMWLFTAFGGVALVIATIGVYATTAYAVSRRRREMNIRVALGARAREVFALVLRQTAAALFAGIALGCAGALAISNVVANLLFDVRPSDPLVIASVAALVAITGLLASATAARQGLRIDPAAALRNE